MLHKAHQDYGTLDWGTQLESSIQLAEEGFRVSPRLAGLITRFGGYILKNDPDTRDYFFLENGEPIPEGFLRDNQAYADTLRAIAKNPRALLEGEIAEDIVAKIKQALNPACICKMSKPEIPWPLHAARMPHPTRPGHRISQSSIKTD